MERVGESVVGVVNARIDRLPRWSLPRATFVGISAAYFFAFYDISVIGFILPIVSKQWDVTGTLLSLPVTFNLIGYMVGSVVIGHIADRHGRRAGLLTTIAVLTIGGFASAASWGIGSLTVFRFITGAGTGAMIPVAATIISEYAPAHKRGVYVQANYWFGALALGAAAPMVSLALLPLGDSAWRLVLALGGLAGLAFLMFSNRMIPESPRWLVLHGRTAEAEQVVERMETFAREKQGGAELPPPGPPLEEYTSQKIPLFELFKRGYVGRLTMLTAFWFFGYVGSYTFYGLSPTFVADMGIAEKDTTLTVALGYLAYPLGAAIAIVAVTKMERKYQVVGGNLLAGIFFALAAFMPSYLWIALMFFIAQLGVTIGAASYALTAELFPTRGRTQGMGIAQGAGHLGGAVGPLLAVPIAGALGGKAGFVFIGVATVISVLILGLFAPRIGKRRLQELAK